MSKYPREGLKGAAPADFHWLSGSWTGRHGEDVVEEYWSPLGADTLMAMLRWQKDDRVFFYELMVIERDGEHLALRIKHFDPVFGDGKKRERRWNIGWFGCATVRPYSSRVTSRDAGSSIGSKPTTGWCRTSRPKIGRSIRKISVVYSRRAS